MQKAEILKENPEWLKKFVNFVNDFDNLNYIKEKKFNDKTGRRIYSPESFA